MLQKIIFTVSFILISICGSAQNDINNFKYVIVPKKFDFSKSEDQYQLNSLTKFLFNKYGYEAYFADDEFPEDLKNDRCLALTLEALKKKGGLFKTKLEIILKDCYSTVVMTSQIGESRIKEYGKAYNQALRDAFETYKEIDYQYVSKQVITVEDTAEESMKNEANNEVEEIKTLDKTTEVISETKSNTKKVSDEQNHLVMYYAQAIENGFQLVDSKPEIVMILLTTAAENVFIVKGKSAIVYKEDGLWFYSENNGKLVEKKTMNIKF